MAKAVISQDGQSITYTVAGRKNSEGKSSVPQLAAVANTVGVLSQRDASLVVSFCNMLVDRANQASEYRKANPKATGRTEEQNIVSQKRMLTEDGVLSTDQISQLEAQGVLDGKRNGMAWNAVNSILKAKNDPDAAQHARDQLVASLQ